MRRIYITDSDNLTHEITSDVRQKPTAKSRNPDYIKVGFYLTKHTVRDLKRQLAGDEMSELFETLVREWLQKQKSSSIQL